MPENSETEGRGGVSRIEAFSDGVLAIIITIMVLELKAPEETGIEHLWRLWPTFLAYVLSYAYVAIYWVNHHRLFSHAKIVTNALVWANMALLFALSLMPFAAAYLGEHLFERDASLLYLLSLLLTALAYNWLQSVIRRDGQQSQAAATYHRATTRKGYAAAFVYALGIFLSYFIVPWLGIGCAALVAVFWILPWSMLDSLFLRREDPVSP